MSNTKDIQFEMTNHDVEYEESSNVENQNAESLGSLSQNNFAIDDFENMNADHEIEMHDDVDEEKDINEHVYNHTDDIIKKICKKDEKELIFCKNGIIDLRTGKLIKCYFGFDSMENVQMLNMHHIPEEDLNLKMKNEVFNVIRSFFPNEKTMRMVMEFLWIALTGHPLDVLNVHFGPYPSGKSIFFDFVYHLWGNYAERCGDKLLSTIDSDAKKSLAKIIGKRLIICDGFATMISASKIKTILATETISRRRIYGDTKCFSNTSKIVVISNDFPKIDHPDISVCHRIQFIPWFDSLNEAKNHDFVRHQRQFDVHYKFRNKKWLESMTPYLFHLIMHYGKSVIGHMNEGLSMRPTPSDESMALHKQFVQTIRDEMENQKNVDNENDQETQSSNTNSLMDID